MYECRDLHNEIKHTHTHTANAVEWDGVNVQQNQSPLTHPTTHQHQNLKREWVREWDDNGEVFIWRTHGKVAEWESVEWKDEKWWKFVI